MSLSNPTTSNPSKRFMQWRGGAEKIVEKDAKGNKSERYEGGAVTFYDKESEENINVPLPFSFIVLDELATITGFHEPSNSGFWSNEVRNTVTDELIVRRKDGIVARGLYGKISEKIKAQGAKYAISCYVAYKDDEGELQIGNLKISGAALSAWLDFKKRFDITQCAVFITEEPKLEKKGTNYYFSPVFDGQNMSEATKSAAIELDKELQQYLNTYLSRRPEVDDAEIVDDEEIEAEAEENERRADEAAEEAAKLPPEEDNDAEEAPAPKKAAADKPKNLSDVEF